MASSSFRSRNDLLNSAYNESTKRNIGLARKLISSYTTETNQPDPNSVTINSSIFVLNLIAKHCKFGTAESLARNTMDGIVQGLRFVYDEFGHTSNWTVLPTGIANGNPLKNNPDLDALRRAHRVHLARFGAVTLRAQPITPGIIVDHAEKYWFALDRVPDVCDVQLHAIMVVGLNLGMQFDEVRKINMENISVTSDGILITIYEIIKNETHGRIYNVREWDGNSSLRNSLLMDPNVALLSWMRMRGGTTGPLFCDYRRVNAGILFNHEVPLPAAKFKDFLRARLLSIGIGEANTKLYTGHSLKRGSVQLYRSLGLLDEYIMQLIGMTGPNAYANYCAAYNDCAPVELPRFSSVEEYIKHAKKIVEEGENVIDFSNYESFLVGFNEVEVHDEEN